LANYYTQPKSFFFPSIPKSQKNMNHLEAIQLNNVGASLLLAGQYKEAAVKFAKSLETSISK